MAASLPVSAPIPTLNESTGEILELVRPEADSRKISLALETGSRHPAVRDDRVQLQQVLLNLLLNAMDAVNDSANNPRFVRGAWLWSGEPWEEMV
jgi:C4-dicarboxylate-specific signal transduction histidine kinase